MHMPPRPSRDPILAAEPGRQVRDLWRALAPERWPLDPSLLPPGTALVGGAVRDGLLGRLAAKPDLDLVVPIDAIALTHRLGRDLGGTCVVLDGKRSIARLVLNGWTIDLARCMGGDLKADLDRRDFSVNAIALPLPAATLNGGTMGQRCLIDPRGGLEDLAAGRLVAISEANLLDDPLRLLRGVRLASELDFSIEPATWGCCGATDDGSARWPGSGCSPSWSVWPPRPSGSGGSRTP